MTLNWNFNLLKELTLTILLSIYLLLIYDLSIIHGSMLSITLKPKGDGARLEPSKHLFI